MGDIILFIVVIVAFTTVWIEWLPRKYDILIGIAFSFLIMGAGLGWIPNWYGWVVVALGFASLARQYHKGVRELGWRQVFDLSKGSGRVWIGGITLAVLSPLFAILAVVALAAGLAIVNAITGHAETLALDLAQATKSVLGNAFLILVGTTDLVLRGILVTGPLLLLAGVGGAKWAARTGSFWKRLPGAGLLIGALYPAMFIVANIFGWFDDSILN